MRRASSARARPRDFAARRLQTIYIGPNRREFVSEGGQVVGGWQGRFSLFSRIVEELTYGCASSAWVYAVLAEHQWIIAQYP